MNNFHRAAALLVLLFSATLASAQNLIPERDWWKPTKFGVHTFSIHSERIDGHTGRPWNNVNPGAYVRWDRVVAGTFYNSIRQQSVYVGYAYPLFDNVDIVFGAVTGYNAEGRAAKAVMPMIIPSVHFAVTQTMSVRLNLALGAQKGAASAVNLALEWKL